MMGLLKGTLTFSRYRLPGKLPGHFKGDIDGQLKKYAFQEISSATEEKSLGWTSLENILDTKFAYGSYAWGAYLAFSLRVDRKTISPALLKVKLLEAERKYPVGSRKPTLSKGQREEIKERVRLELLKHTPFVPSFYDVCWSPTDNWLIFSSLAPKATEDFEKLFQRTFDLSLSPFVPWDPRYLDPATAQQVTSLPKGVFLAPQSAPENNQDPSFLGREFLTWLWFKSEERGGAVMIPGTGDVEVILARRLILESGDGEYSETVICQGLHADLKEGKAAIREGKKIKEARIMLGVGTDQWELTLKADRFQFQSVKLPAGMAMDEEEEEKEGRILERIYLMERVLNTVDQLFTLFLTKRLSAQWSAEDIPRMKKWIQK
jgi:recombination associated protein RdgC